MGIAYNVPSIVKGDLALHLDAKNPKSYPGTGTTWTDISGKDNHATLSGTDYMTWNSSGHFESRPIDSFATGNHFTIPASSKLSVSTGWTVAGYMKVIGTQSSNGVGWFHKNGTASERGIHLEPLTNNFRINGDSGWSSPTFNISTNYHGVWTQWCVTFEQISGTYGTDTGTLKVYINGSLTTTKTDFIPSPDKTDSDIWLCRRNGHLRHYLNGDVANYLFYTRTLSASEVLQNYNAIKARYES